MEKREILRHGVERSPIWVVIPAYNEEMVVGDVVRQLWEQTVYSIVLIDDGSTDDTVGKASQVPIFILRHQHNLGTGAALQTGFTFCREKNALCCVTFDADGQHSVEDIGPLVHIVLDEGYDVALGSRFLTDYSRRQVPYTRRLLLRGAVVLTRFLSDIRITDTHNGLRAFGRHALQSLQLTEHGMVHASEILALIAELKLTYCEVPVTIRYTAYSREKGQGIGNFIMILWDLIRIKRRYKSEKDGL